MEWQEKYTAIKMDEGSYGAIYAIEGDPFRVIKALHPDYTDPEDRRRLQREIHCLDELQGNPNVIEILDSNVNAALPWFVMPRATTNLLNYVENQGRLDITLIISFTRSILHAIEYAHSRGILHRDLGPIFCYLFLKLD